MRVYCKVNGKLEVWNVDTEDHKEAIETVEDILIVKTPVFASIPCKAFWPTINKTNHE